MIFKIDGEVGELLALTPIIREWRKRNKNQKVFIETNTPEVFAGNPDVDEAGISLPVIGDYYDMNFVRWNELGISVVEVYAKMVLGDKNLSTWKTEMFHNENESEVAKSLIPRTDRKVAVCSFSQDVISGSSSDGVVGLLKDKGYEVIPIGRDTVETLGVAHAVIGMADLFVGTDGDMAAVALTTKTPAIVCYSVRPPVYFPPFRGGIPFVGLVPNRLVCEHGPVCHARHSMVEWSKFYSYNCMSKDKFCCQKRDLKDDVLLALGRIWDQA